MAGLIPGASEGRGLGNKFLDDLRHATVLIHVVDVSGTTNEKGEKTSGYDPCSDIEWLQEELQLWIYNNVSSAWTNLIRKHVRSKSTPQEALISQLSGYGCNAKFIQDFLYFISSTPNSISSEPKTAIEKWTEADVKEAMKLFVQFRFPSIIVLNKIDMNSSSKHVEKMYTKYDQHRIVCCSSLSECVLKKYHKKGYIHYELGTNSFEEITIPDKHVQQTLQHIKDLVLYRYDGTGVYDAIQKAVELYNPILCFPVQDFSFLNATSLQQQQQQQHDYFTTCHVIKKGSIFRDLCQEFYSHTAIHSIEGLDGRKVSFEEVITEENRIFKIIFIK